MNDARPSAAIQQWTLLVIAVVVEVISSICLKAALDHPWLYVVVVVGYVAAFALLARILQLGMPLGVAYGLWGALGVALTAVASALIFGETITPTMAGGLVCVIGGVMLVELGSRHEPATELPEVSP